MEQLKARTFKNKQIFIEMRQDPSRGVSVIIDDVMTNAVNKAITMFSVLPMHISEYSGPRRASRLSKVGKINLLMLMLHRVVDNITNITRAA